VLQLRHYFKLPVFAVASAFIVSACGGGSDSTTTIATQTITAVASPTTLTTGGTSALSTTGGTGTGAVTYSVTSGSCTVSGGTLTAPSSAGSCVVTASKAADSTHSAASSTVTVTVLAAQTITAVASPTTVSPGGTSTLSTTGGSGTGAVTYAVTSGSCTISSATLTAPSSAGSCVVTATKAADAIYAGATSTVTVAVISYTFSSGLNINGITANGGTWGYYGGGTSAPALGFANGKFLNGTGAQLASTADETFVGYYQNLVAADVAGYSYSGNYVEYSSTSGLTTTGATSVNYGVAINSEWLANAAGAKFVVLLAANVPGVSTSICNPVVAAVVAATSTNMTTYTTPLSSFTHVAQDCGDATVTAAQILAQPVVKLDFQVDGGASAITASGLTSNANTSVFTGGTAPAGGTGPYLPVVLLINGVIKFQ
jgi:hypothetical protein